MSAPRDQATDLRLRLLREFVARSSNVGPQAALDRSAAVALRAFQEAGVAVLLLKGPVLAQRLYRPDEHRSYLDIDVLVDPERREMARVVLARLGYNNRATEAAGVDDFLGVLHAETWAGPNGCCIDLHWRLSGCGPASQEAWTLLYAGRSTIDVGDYQADVLGDQALALHVATHAAQGGPEDVKALGDLVRAVERLPLAQWQGAARLADALGANDALASGLHLLSAGARLANDLGLPPSPRLSWTIRHRASRPRGTFHVGALIEARGWPARTEIVRRSLLPGPAWIAAQSPWARRNRPALVAAYALHLVRAPLWAIRAWRFDRRARSAGPDRDPEP